MSILSDRQIRLRCQAPTYKLDEDKYLALMRLSGEMPAAEILADPREYDTWARARTNKLYQDSLVETTQEERDAFRPMIHPFSPMQIKTCVNSLPITHNGAVIGHKPSGPERKIISRGTTSYGYDVSLSGEFQIFTNVNGAFIDPKRPNPACLIDAKLLTDEYGDQFVWLPPNSYLLGWTEEYFVIPRDVVAVCVGKSTYARAGVQVNVTPIEPGFEGTVVIEIANSTSLPVKIYAHEGISQFLFLVGSEPCETSYADRGGKYQGQMGIVHAKV